MYRYDEFDAEFVRQRVAQFRDQVGRRLSGELTEDEFKPLRLMNAAHRHPIRHSQRAPDAQARPHRAGL